MHYRTKENTMKLVRLTVIIAALLSLVAIAAMAAPDQTMTGWVMDAKCAAKGAAANADCAKKCIEKGEAMVLVNDADKSIVTIANPKVLEDHIGHHVKVEGSVADNKLTVTSAEMLPDKK
jgi:hypothetical protein